MDLGETNGSITREGSIHDSCLRRASDLNSNGRLMSSKKYRISSASDDVTTNMAKDKPETGSSAAGNAERFEKLQAKRSPRARAFFDFIVNELGFTDATLDDEAAIVPGSRSSNEKKVDMPPRR